MASSLNGSDGAVFDNVSPLHTEAVPVTDGDPESYNKRAKNYDQEMIPIDYTGYKSVVTKWQTFHPLLSQPHTDEGNNPISHRIFDAGCGTGLLGEHLSKVVPCDNIDLYGGDLSPGMIEMAKQKKVYADLRVVDLKEPLPYETESFDSVVSSGVFTLRHCGPECLPNVVRILKKGCYMIFTVRKELLEQTKAEWFKQIEECGCEFIEELEMPYTIRIVGIVMVIQKIKA